MRAMRPRQEVLNPYYPSSRDYAGKLAEWLMIERKLPGPRRAGRMPVTPSRGVTTRVTGRARPSPWPDG